MQMRSILKIKFNGYVMRCLIWLIIASLGGAVFFRRIVLLLCCSMLVACARTPTAQQWVLSQSHLQQARTALVARQWQLARAELRAANRISQRHNPLYWTYLTHAEMGLGQPAAAVLAARHAWQLLPNAATTLNNYAIALCQRAAQLSATHKLCQLRQPDAHGHGHEHGHWQKSHDHNRHGHRDYHPRAHRTSISELQF